MNNKANNINLNRINFFLFILLLNFILFSSQSSAFLYGSIFSLESLNIAKSNGIELSPGYNSRTTCIVRQKQYNRDFPKYIRSTCFQKQDDNNKYYYLICEKSFGDCNVDIYLGNPINADSLNNSTGKGPKGSLQNQIMDAAKKIIENQKELYGYSSKELLIKSESITTTLQEILKKESNSKYSNENIYKMLEGILKKQNKELLLDFSKKYTLKNMTFTNKTNLESYTIKDLLSRNIPEGALDNMYDIKLTFFDPETKEEHMINLTFKYTDSGEDVSLDTILKDVFKDEDDTELSVDDLLKVVFEDEEDKVEVVVKPEDKPEDNEEESDFNIDDILQMFNEESDGSKDKINNEEAKTIQEEQEKKTIQEEQEKKRIEEEQNRKKIEEQTKKDENKKVGENEDDFDLSSIFKLFE